MLKVLVTGANGFVGSHVVEALLEAKHYVVCPLRKTADLKWIRGLYLDCKYGDLSDKDFLKKIVKDVDIIIHCAGVVRAMIKDEYFKINVKITKDLCKTVLKINPGLKKFVFISSQAAMGPSMSADFRKLTDKECPISDYGLSKLVAEREVKKVLFGKVLYTILRPAAIYGPRDNDIFIFFKLVHKHLRPVTLMKKLLQLAYVKDVASCAIDCLENIKTNNNCYYLADTTAYTWSDIGKIISFSADVKTVPIIIPDFVFRFVGVTMEFLSYFTRKPALLNSQKVNEILREYWTGDTGPSKRDLNVNFTSLEVGSKITYSWYLNNKFF
ncbi:MAG: NAD(P)-dependent oxidoreductase [Endomicrobium sp.]|jgi:nucleoside-diphosphate-sugar epimerase|nr:NAD(P)-dependent oxidoreductase [Endomicrobium sp.]